MRARASQSTPQAVSLWSSAWIHLSSSSGGDRGYIVVEVPAVLVGHGEGRRNGPKPALRGSDAFRFNEAGRFNGLQAQQAGSGSRAARVFQESAHTDIRTSAFQPTAATYGLGHPLPALCSALYRIHNKVHVNL
jgi:hypothetical protein